MVKITDEFGCSFNMEHNSMKFENDTQGLKISVENLEGFVFPHWIDKILSITLKDGNISHVKVNKIISCGHGVRPFQTEDEIAMKAKIKY